MLLDGVVGPVRQYEDLARASAQRPELFCAGLGQDMDPEGRFRLVNGQPTVNFGRNRGRRLKDMSREEPGFLRWILKGDFAAPVKEIARRFLPEEERGEQHALPLDDPQPSLPLDLPRPQR